MDFSLDLQKQILEQAGAMNKAIGDAYRNGYKEGYADARHIFENAELKEQQEAQKDVK